MTTNRNELLYPELSYRIVGLCFEAHNEIGRFAREKQYADFLENKLKDGGIEYKREFTIRDSGNIVDFLIEDKIILELKTTRALERLHFRQIQNYLQQSKVKLGLLINFSDKHLSPKRIIRIENKY
jgi:GxxExxY protein